MLLFYQELPSTYLILVEKAHTNFYSTRVTYCVIFIELCAASIIYHHVVLCKGKFYLDSLNAYRVALIKLIFLKRRDLTSVP